MIYLFDDKINRQIDYGWTSEKFENYSNTIRPIYQFDEENDKILRESVFSQENVILFHESFFENSLNKHSKGANKIRLDLNNFAKNNQNFKLVYFSGSKRSRRIDQNVGHLPVSILYQNLELFIKECTEDQSDLRFLLFGSNYNLEENLLQKLEAANNNLENSVEASNPSSHNFIALTLQNEIETVFENAEYKTFFLEEKYNFEITDEYLSKKIIEWFSEEEYDNIFIPLCFGPILSDYNGLRLAMHIRCTKTLNQLKNIFLYGFVDYSYIIKNEFFDILKTKNVHLIEYSKNAFGKALLHPTEFLDSKNLPKEIRKIKLEVPENYEDSHSIANEWAIFRWSSAINALDEDIESIILKVDHQLYFKYLSTIYPTQEIPEIAKRDLKIIHTGNPKVLYIDDEADKGWSEIFCSILYDVNELDFTYLDEELNTLSQDEIIALSVEKIKSDDIDLVLLDFRLHPNDFISSNIEEVTGLRLLRAIKDMNPGIQVIMFSATDKTWNLQVLQEAQADGFIIKESPERSIDPRNTSDSIEKLITTINSCLSRMFLKKFYSDLSVLKSQLNPRKNYNTSTNPLPKEFVNESLKWLELSYDLLRGENTQDKLAASFIFMFSVIEDLTNRVINIDNPIQIDDNGRQYKFEFRGEDKRLKRFIEDENNSGFYRRTKTILTSKRNIPWYQKILNAIDFITEEQLDENQLSKMIKARNDFIHANNTTGDVFQIDYEMLKFLNSIIYKGLLNVK